jgi:inorganic pyrophosphatase
LAATLLPCCTTASQQLAKTTLNLIDGHAATTCTGEIQVVVEIPAGSNAKWEVSKVDGQLRWQNKEGRPRVVQYLAYPGNYGMVPRTLLPKALGGDGDPLDVIVVGPAVVRGALIQAHIVGVLKLTDGGERDDKLVAVPTVGVLSNVRDLEDLQSQYPGVTSIIETWFRHYKGAGQMKSEGFGDEKVAAEILAKARKAWRQHHPQATLKRCAETP